MEPHSAIHNLFSFSLFILFLLQQFDNQVKGVYSVSHSDEKL